MLSDNSWITCYQITTGLHVTKFVLDYMLSDYYWITFNQISPGLHIIKFVLDYMLSDYYWMTCYQITTGSDGIRLLLDNIWSDYYWMDMHPNTFQIQILTLLFLDDQTWFKGLVWLVMRLCATYCSLKGSLCIKVLYRCERYSYGSCIGVTSLEPRQHPPHYAEVDAIHRNSTQIYHKVVFPNEADDVRLDNATP